MSRLVVRGQNSTGLGGEPDQRACLHGLKARDSRQIEGRGRGFGGDVDHLATDHAGGARRNGQPVA